MVVVWREVREYHYRREYVCCYERMKETKVGKWIFVYVLICV